MIQDFVTRFDQKRAELADQFSKAHPGSYAEIVKMVITAVTSEESYRDPDPKRIHCIDDGHYQGTLIFVIAAKGYRPSDYWYVRVWYGSCSGCDTLEGIKGYEDALPTKDQVDQYMVLALHIVQGLKMMQFDETL